MWIIRKCKYCEKLSNIYKEIKILQKHEEEIMQRRIVEDTNFELEGMINEKDAKIYDLVHHVDELEAKHNALEKNYSDKTTILEERLDTIKKKAKFALRAKNTASQESSWRAKHQPSTQNKQTKSKYCFWENGMNAAQSNKELDS
jgi:hypothetical protein